MLLFTFTIDLNTQCLSSTIVMGKAYLQSCMESPGTCIEKSLAPILFSLLQRDFPSKRIIHSLYKSDMKVKSMHSPGEYTVNLCY